ncbi:pyruvate, phosphate dikinase [Lentilactobacillus parabuchneri]|uniref:pyruvate, phosphate dikinase n=2 Tax=Lentilactobacillus TaxID=2767893 RepID=UPI000A0FD08C|nr:pyruvate, phosphate dikinase [Lentilactobacillus parabuchneri]MDN6787025.1 pyruvate, phosphate dikinase [Lentilactobacillus parabuchneri]MDN6808514.1 pyruvate, phosphate dikinase [Lentilactobacillus parabuchneri]ORN10454.1 Pyruvate, phosphate dikinase [Lentilactobacillus parabuchneri]
MKYIYRFEEGNKDMRRLLGGKGANLAQMTTLGFPVPDGFTITTEACQAFYDNNNQINDDTLTQIEAAIAQLSEKVGKQFNSPTNPLLVSVRSGAAISMPGMMDTILNIGLNDQTVEVLANMTDNRRFAYDSYRRLLAMFGNVVYEIPEGVFDQVLEDVKTTHNYQSDLDLTVSDLKEIVDQFKDLYVSKAGKVFPQDPKEQLLAAVNAVFESWNNHRAQVYRRENHIASDLGTAVNIQMMVFGNAGEDSGTGVAFTRNPATGENKLFGEYLLNAQGEDVVAGIRTPQPISTLADTMPDLYNEFAAIAKKLEFYYRDMQDLEFTIEHGTLYMLQARDGKRTPTAAVKIAVDLVDEGLISQTEALLRINPDSVGAILYPEFDEAELDQNTVAASGLPASPGAASGQIYFTAESAKAAHDDLEQQVILVRQDTSPEDIEGMVISEAIVTSRGGMTSHAAVVARGMGTPATVGVNGLQVDYQNRVATISGEQLNEGDWISVDGTNGNIYIGQIMTNDTKVNDNLSTILEWSKQESDMGVYANADTPADFAQALKFGADGIGLTRTEHMFFKPERLLEMRRLIIAEDAKEREAPLAELAKMQQGDFYELFRLSEGRSVTIRLLDPPLHEFLPHDEKEIQKVADQLNIDPNYLARRVDALKEINPMLGHRGDRLAVTFPDIYEMQVRAIIEAALDLLDQGLIIEPHIMIPLTGSKAEMKWVREVVVNQVEQLFAKKGAKLEYTVGTMMEIPRACLTADKVAEVSDFFSFGTNDLTQLTYGFSRDDVGSFMPEYIKKGILPADPFQTVDVDGVGELMKMAVEKGRFAKPNLPIGVCGEIGGDPKSIEFFEAIHVSYVSCSPYRVPIAKLAAAQAHIKLNKKKDVMANLVKN